LHEVAIIPKDEPARKKKARDVGSSAVSVNYQSCAGPLEQETK
jgi:hypothetical protein